MLGLNEVNEFGRVSFVILLYAFNPANRIVQLLCPTKRNEPNAFSERIGNLFAVFFVCVCVQNASSLHDGLALDWMCVSYAGVICEIG